MKTDDTNRAPVVDGVSARTMKKDKEKRLVSALIVLAVLISAAYYWRTYKAAVSVDQSTTALDSSYADQPFTFTTTVTGATCSMNVCAGDAQCIPLSGTVGKTGNCVLDQEQATPEAQGLYAIVVPA